MDGQTTKGIAMIERHETVPPEYTDEQLTAELEAEQEWVREATRLLLQAPPQYRQGVEIYVHDKCYTRHYVETQFGRMARETPTGVRSDDARREALAVLAGQGVQLNQGA
jgi:hypothetical protein